MSNSSRIFATVGLVVAVGAIAAIVLTGRSSAEPAPAAAVQAEPLPAPSSTDAVVPSGSDSAEPDTATPTIEAATTTAAPIPDAPDLPDRGVHPELLEIDGWLQSDVSSLEELRGQVVAVQFWTFGCSNCKATLPHMQALYETYADQGLEIVGIHSPEFDFEADVDNIVEAAADLGVTWPIVLDTNKQTFHSWQEGRTGFWPRIYLLDRDGHIRYDHTGEGRYSKIDAAVQTLLAEPA